MPSDRMSRRLFLGGAAAGAAALALPGCSSSGNTDASGRPHPHPPPSSSGGGRIRRPGDRPRPDRPEGEDLLPEIGHIVVVMMENHSFDNHLGTLGRGDGLTFSHGVARNTNAYDGKRLRSFPMPSGCQLAKLPGQDWNRSHISYADGTNDGFVTASGPVAMGYFTDDTLPYYHRLARTFTLCDRWFASCMAQTYPNRRFLIAGTALGLIDDPFPSPDDPQPPNGTIFERLDAHQVDWADYFTSLPTGALFLKELTAYASRFRRIDAFYADAAAGRLPSFCLVEPDFEGESEENPDDVRKGEQFVHKVVDAVMRSPNWHDTVLIWCYDEHGGYYDHVPPPAAIPPDDVKPVLPAGFLPGGYDRYGFRVPAVVVSPFSRRDHVSHVVYDHTSILKLVETKWNLGALTFRDANAHDLLDCLDLKGRPAFLEPPDLGLPALARPDPKPCTEGDPGGPIPPADAVVA